MTSPQTRPLAPLSRRTLIGAAGVASLGLAAPRLLASAAARQAESVQEILDIAATAEALAVTVVGEALASAGADGYDPPLPEAVGAVFQAVRAADQAHLEFLRAAGAAPLTLEFTVPVRSSGTPSAILADPATLLSTAAVLKGALVAAYLAAARAFAEGGEPGLVKAAFQIGAIEAEHRVLAAHAVGIRPANNLAFAEPMFETVGAAAQALTQLGWLGGAGPTIAYPGRGEIDQSGLTSTEPGGPAVECAPA
jgi:hypothetical protein